MAVKVRTTQVKIEINTERVAGINLYTRGVAESESCIRKSTNSRFDVYCEYTCLLLGL